MLSDEFLLSSACHFASFSFEFFRHTKSWQATHDSEAIFAFSSLFARKVFEDKQPHNGANNGIALHFQGMLLPFLGNRDYCDIKPLNRISQQRLISQWRQKIT